MGTLNQKKAAEITVEKVGKGEKVVKGEILAESGYSRAIQTNPDKVFETEGFKEELKKLGFDSNNAKRVVGEILNSEMSEDGDRIRAAQTIFKVNGDFAPDKSITVNFQADEEALKQIIGTLKPKTA